MLKWRGWACVVIGWAVMAAAGVCADDPGLAELDEATDLRLNAKSLEDLSKVVEKGEAAIAKGLSDDNKKFAQDLVSSALLQRATTMSQAIFRPGGPSSRWEEIRKLSLDELEKAVKLAPKSAPAFRLIARLEALPRGNRERAQKALDVAVEHAEDELTKVEALLMRANFATDETKRQADYDEAVKIAPKSADALRARGMFHFERQKHDAALADFRALVALDEKSPAAHETLAGAQLMANKVDDAIASYTRAIDLAKQAGKPPQGPFLVGRARAHALKQDLDKAIEDATAALKESPNDLGALMLRARIYLADDDLDNAEADAKRMLRVRPGLVAGIELLASVHAAQGRYEEAIDALELLNRDRPKDKERLMQLAGLYVMARKPRLAIDRYSEVIKLDDKDWMAWYGRGDAALSLGRHEDALADYNKAYGLKNDHSGVLNNLAWLLATSPNDKVRDGKRSIEVGKKACEVTQFKRPHILSTLAAGYAEAGDWENAVKWSTRALEICEEDDDNLPQLKQELESYKNKKPWRELQNVEEEDPNPPSPKKKKPTPKKESAPKEKSPPPKDSPKDSPKGESKPEPKPESKPSPPEPKEGAKP